MDDKFRANIYLDGESGEKIKIMAKKNYMNTSAFLRKIILEYLDENLEETKRKQNYTKAKINNPQETHKQELDRQENTSENEWSNNIPKFNSKF